MPLPPALAARLAKRGLIKEKSASKHKPSEEVEEVFAEDYDDPDKPDVHPLPVITSVPIEEKNITEIDVQVDKSDHVHEVTACPNRVNPYHTCVNYCRNRWGLKTFSPELDMLKRRDRMLKMYPLPDGWKEVADPDTGRYYYWSIQTDQVSWLSPGHPKAIISLPAEKLSGVDEDFEDQDEDMEEIMGEPMEGDSDLSSVSSDSDSEDEKYRRMRDAGKARRHDDRDRRRGGRNRKDDLDPMDPASYSDVPRGGWTDGLDTRGSAKTGVDVTASGPLFQQRPYPSPGDILRANQSLKK